MRKSVRNSSMNESGFTLIELVMAMAVLMVGLVACAQLVPLAVSLNAANRQDSTAVVIAQRELNQMTAQALTSATFTDDLNNQCSLGNAATPGQPVGSPMVTISGSPRIDFAAAQQPGYSFNYRDPNDPSNATYDVRWSVVTSTNPAGGIIGKRFVIGVRRVGGNGPLIPVTLDTTVQR